MTEFSYPAALAPAALGGGGPWWPLRFVSRTLRLAEAALIPLRLVAVALEVAMALVLGGAILLIWAWMTHRVSDADAAALIAPVGERILSLLHQQHVF